MSCKPEWWKKRKQLSRLIKKTKNGSEKCLLKSILWEAAQLTMDKIEWSNNARVILKSQFAACKKKATKKDILHILSSLLKRSGSGVPNDLCFKNVCILCVIFLNFVFQYPLITCA